jgi:hypothetical protein
MTRGALSRWAWTIASVICQSNHNRCLGAELIADQSLKLELVRIAFASGQVRPLQGPGLDWSPELSKIHGLGPDALAGEPEFEMVNDAERPDGIWHRVRFQAYELKAREGTRRFVALAHGHVERDRAGFYGRCCEWSANLFLIWRDKLGWHAHTSDAQLIYRGNTIRRFEVTDIDGDGFEEAIVEAEQSGAPSDDGIGYWFEMYIFALRDSMPQTLLDIPVLGIDYPEIRFEAKLDRPATRSFGGSKYCFSATVFADVRREQSACVERGFRGRPPW